MVGDKQIESSCRVLVVEDDGLIAALLGDMLEELGHVVCGTANGAPTAVQIASETKPDLMIVDLRLGLESGFDAVATILRTQAMPHIFMSGSRELLAGLNPEAIFLTKPFNGRDLERGIRRALSPKPGVATGRAA